MQSTPLRVGLIGFGYASQTFHAPLLRTTPGLRITAVSSRDAARVHAALGPDIAVLDDAHALATRADIDLVVIASPNATHAGLAHAALAAGKHVVVDKPFTLDAAAAERLAQMAAPGQVLSVFHNRRWDSSTLAAGRMLASGRLGPVRHAALHFDRFRPQPRDRWREDGSAGGGIWLDLGSHLIDEALSYFGTPLAIHADIHAMRPGARADDGFLARLRYADGLRVGLGASMLAGQARPRVALHGLRGSYVKQGLDQQENDLKAGLLPQDGVRWGRDAEDGVAVLELDGEMRTQAVSSPDGDYPAYYRQLRDAILGKGDNPVTPGQAVLVMRLLDAGRRSSEERREVLLDE
jgi:predicted dehydrogenase